MISAAAVLTCALEILGRAPSTLPPIEFVKAPMVTADVEAFVRPASGVISLVTDSDVFEVARLSQCETFRAVVKLASIIVHEEWHVRHGGDERGAYEAQLDALAQMGVAPNSPLYLGVQRSMLRVIDASRKTGGRAGPLLTARTSGIIAGPSGNLVP